MKSKKRKIKYLWDVCSMDYDGHMNQTKHYLAQEKIVELLFDQFREPILDLACGPGFLMSMLLKNFAVVLGNDFSLKMKESAENKCNIIVTNEDAEKLESYKNKFSTIISCNLFFYLQNRVKAIKRWKELLESNGKIIFIEEFPFIKPEGKSMDKYNEELIDLIDPMSPDQIVQMMVDNGFNLVKKIKIPIDKKHKLYGLVFSV